MFRSRLSHVFETSLDSDSYIEFGELLPKVNEGMDVADLFGTREARAAIGRMNERNEVMFADGIVYKI